jgi:hypothetical protein
MHTWLDHATVAGSLEVVVLITKFCEPCEAGSPQDASHCQSQDIAICYGKGPPGDPDRDLHNDVMADRLQLCNPEETK